MSFSRLYIKILCELWKNAGCDICGEYRNVLIFDGLLEDFFSRNQLFFISDEHVGEVWYIFKINEAAFSQVNSISISGLLWNMG